MHRHSSSPSIHLHFQKKNQKNRQVIKQVTHQEKNAFIIRTKSKNPTRIDLLYVHTLRVDCVTNSQVKYERQKANKSRNKSSKLKLLVSNEGKKKISSCFSFLKLSSSAVASRTETLNNLPRVASRVWCLVNPIRQFIDSLNFLKKFIDFQLFDKSDKFFFGDIFFVDQKKKTEKKKNSQ